MQLMLRVRSAGWPGAEIGCSAKEKLQPVMMQGWLMLADPMLWEMQALCLDAEHKPGAGAMRHDAKAEIPVVAVSLPDAVTLVAGAAILLVVAVKLLGAEARQRAFPAALPGTPAQLLVVKVRLADALESPLDVEANRLDAFAWELEQ